MMKHYIEFRYAGVFISECSVQPVDSREPPARLPKGAYAYRFFDRQEIAAPDGETLRGGRRNYSPWTIFGDEFDEARVIAEVPDNQILLANMRGNGWRRVARCAQGFINVADNDVVRPVSEGVWG